MLKDGRKLAHVPSLTEQEGRERGRKATQMEETDTKKLQSDTRKEQQKKMNLHTVGDGNERH